MYRARNRSLLMYTTAVVRLFETPTARRCNCSRLGRADSVHWRHVVRCGSPLPRILCSDRLCWYSSSRPRKFAPERLVPSETTRRIKVHFNADTSEALPWQFIPSQKYVSVTPGESTLAFYKAHNKSDKDVIGIATYNVTPDRVSWAWTCALRSLMITILL